MARSATLSGDDLLREVVAAGPGGVAPDALTARFKGSSRSTLNRRLRDLVTGGHLKAVGRGPGTRYVALVRFAEADIRRYFETDWQERPLASFREELLLPEPGIDSGKAARLGWLNAISRPLDRKFLADFLIDFSWASSLLEGGTYSAIDTQALLEYGQRNPDKPVEDALLVLNHKNAIEYLWTHRDLSVETLCQLQSLLTDRHDLPEAAESEHFLPDGQRGAPREYEEVRLGRSAYGPPFRPGTGYIRRALAEIVATASKLDAVTAALYLMTRLPYLQAFANGNKRTSRLAANLPLLAAGMLPISFVDFAKADYVLGMSAFYELGDIQIMERVFIQGYVRSIVRGSDLPAAVRVPGFRISDVVAELVEFVQSGRLPAGAGANRILNAER